MVNGLKLKLFDDSLINVKKPKILIAGCGTGQHSLFTKSNFKNSTIVILSGVYLFFNCLTSDNINESLMLFFIFYSINCIFILSNSDILTLSFKGTNLLLFSFISEINKTVVSKFEFKPF